MVRTMKDSGIEWIGEIPTNWKLVSVRQLFNIGRGRVIATTELEDSGYPVYSSQTKNNGVLGYIKTYDFDISQLTWTTDGANAGTVFLREGKHNCTNVCGTLQPKTKDVFLPYMKYALGHIAFYNKRVDINGAKIMNNEMAAITTIMPSLVEQEKIAAFLDDKCGAIDDIITKTEQSIEEYKKLKQSVITKAVTKGIRPNRLMQDSNIEWIGEIPTDWNVRKIANIFQTVTDYVASGSFGDLAKNVKYLDNPDYAQLIRTTDVSGKGFSQKPVYIDEASYNYLKNSNLFGGEIILPNIGASVGDVYIVPKLYKKMSLAPNSVMLKTNQNMMYFYYFFASKSGREALLSIAESTAQPKFNKTELRQLKIPQPSIQEQKEIADYLDEKCAEIDTLIEKKQQFLAEMANYKKSLIYEYVTGKKEVA